MNGSAQTPMEGSSQAHAHRRAGEADFGQTAAEAVSAGEKGGAAGGAGLFAVVMEELHALGGEAIDVRAWY